MKEKGFLFFTISKACRVLMLVFELLGYSFLFAATIASSVSMNFQKLAQHETHFHDPRKRARKRSVPLTSTVFCRPLFILALCLSFAAATLDFLALTWLPPATVGIFGCIAIGVNLLVTKIILFETPHREEWYSIGMILVGSLMAILVKVDNEPDETPPQLIERTSSCVYITLQWVVFITASQIMEHMKMPEWIEQLGFPFIAGAIGSQNVCMGKYIAYSVSNAVQHGHLLGRTDVLISTLALCTASIVLHVVWLNRGLEKHDAYICVIVYQTSWFLFTTLSGIVVYDNMAMLGTLSQFIFTLGCGLAIYGVWNISVIHSKIGQENIDDMI